ncbi:hypothetical protein BGW37DRAFT_17325 [Umbelopsis sp. PMI_123]|nr:hypothetical protein BGW37DRAFT_17325 [Umbelopsis sp. PMI_123]
MQDPINQPPPPPLPAGWIAQWDPTQGRYFYANTVTGTTQWEIPAEPVSSGESNSYQGAPPGYSPSPSTPGSDGTSDRGLGSFISGALGGGRPQNSYGGGGYGYPNNYNQNYNQSYSQGQSSGFPGGGMGGAIAGGLMGLAAGKLMGGGHHHNHHGLIGNLMPPPIPYGGFSGPQYGYPGQNYGHHHGHHGHHHGHHHHHHGHHGW